MFHMFIVEHRPCFASEPAVITFDNIRPIMFLVLFTNLPLHYETSVIDKELSKDIS